MFETSPLSPALACAIECTGKFNSKDKLISHIRNGAKKVIVSAPCKSADKTIVYGVNHNNISNKDKKNMCLAKAKTQSSYCYNISNNDTKNMCIAVVKGKKSYCYNIRNRDEKNVCLSNF